MADNELSGNSEQLESGHEKDHVADPGKMVGDLISRQDAIDLFPNDALEWDTKGRYIAPHLARQMIEALPSARPKARPIDYQDCSNAMLRMWMDNVVTDGEYNRIMDKLNEHEKKKGVLNEGQKNERYNQQTGGDCSRRAVKSVWARGHDGVGQ